jgi:hypothetical protein
MLAKGRGESRVSLSRVFLPTLAGLLLFPVSLAPGRPQEAAPPPAATGLSAALEELQKRYPGGFRAAWAGREIAGKLLRDTKYTPGSAEEARARLLAAEVLEAAGEDQEALRLRELTRDESLEAADRARAAFEIGLAHLLREQYLAAGRAWRQVPLLAPGSPWALRVERQRPYFEVLQKKAAPDFSAQFAAAGAEARAVSGKDLLGRLWIIHFWSAAALEERDRIEGLGRIAERLQKRDGKPPELLGVNLDAAPDRFQEATKGWKIVRPEHHDGLGFEGPLPRAFGIPRAPHFAAFDPQGRLIYLGGDLARLEARLFPAAPPPSNPK